MTQQSTQSTEALRAEVRSTLAAILKKAGTTVREQLDALAEEHARRQARAAEFMEKHGERYQEMIEFFEAAELRKEMGFSKSCDWRRVARPHAPVCGAAIRPHICPFCGPLVKRHRGFTEAAEFRSIRFCPTCLRAKRVVLLGGDGTCWGSPAAGSCRCKFHGGRSTGPQTTEGRRKISRAVAAANSRRKAA